MRPKTSETTVDADCSIVYDLFMTEMYFRLYEKSICFGILPDTMNIILFDDEPFFPRNDTRYQHIKKVLRKKSGDSFFAGIINGSEGLATITRFDDSGLWFDFSPETLMRSLYPVCLIVGFPRPIQLKRLLRDVSSLGVAQIFLTGTELGEKSYRESTLVDRGAARESLIEGCMQAGGTAIPILEMFDDVTEALSSIGLSQRIVLDTTHPECNLIHAPFGEISSKRPLVLAIGSERGWTDRERNVFSSSGFISCSLGTRILRTETAATVALGIALAKTGLMEGKE